MNVLITGASGGVGQAVLNECSKRKHKITVIGRQSERAEKVYKEYEEVINKVIWADLTNKEEVKKALKNQDVIIHLAAIIPPLSEKKQELTQKINVGVTRNIIESIKELKNKTKLVFTSSAAVMGITQHKKPPIKVSAALKATNNYTKTKIECEKLIKKSKIKYVIVRLAAVMNTISKPDFSMMKEAFNLRLKNRMEVVIDLDVATALLNASELLQETKKIDKKIFFIGGGEENGCWLTVKEMQKRMFEAYGIGMLNEDYYTKKPYPIDWLDTKESQKYLKYQNHSFQYYLDGINEKVKFVKPIIKLFSPLIRKWIENQSEHKRVKNNE